MHGLHEEQVKQIKRVLWRPGFSTRASWECVLSACLPALAHTQTHILGGPTLVASAM